MTLGFLYILEHHDIKCTLEMPSFTQVCYVEVCFAFTSNSMCDMIFLILKIIP